MSGHRRNKPRRKVKNRFSSRKKLIGGFILIAAVITSAVLLYINYAIPYIYWPRNIIVQGYAPDGKTSNYAAKDGGSILFYAAYGGINGIYRLNPLNGSVSRFCKSDEITAIAANNSKVFYSYVTSGADTYNAVCAVKAVDKKTKSSYTINSNKVKGLVDQLYSDNHTLFIDGDSYLDTQNLRGPIIEISSLFHKKDFFFDYADTASYVRYNFRSNYTIFGIHSLVTDDTDFNVIENKTGDPISIYSQYSSFPIYQNNGTTYETYSGSIHESSAMINSIWKIDNKKDTEQICELPNLSGNYDYSYFNRIGNKVILLSQSYNKAIYRQSDQYSNISDCAVSYDLKTRKSDLLLRTAKMQRILYCDLKKAIVYSNDSVFQVALKSGKWTKLYTLPTCHKLVAQTCGNYLFLYSCVGSFSDRQNYGVNLLTYIKIN